MFFFDFSTYFTDLPFYLIGASPEMHVRLEDRCASLRPIAGTKPRGETYHQDIQLKKELLDDPRPYDLRLNAPALADRDILLIGGWDDHEVTIEDRILPFYRALKEAGAQTVQIAAVQDDHSFEKCGQEVVELIVRWLKSPEPF